MVMIERIRGEAALVLMIDLKVKYLSQLKFRHTYVASLDGDGGSFESRKKHQLNTCNVIWELVILMRLLKM